MSFNKTDMGPKKAFNRLKEILSDVSKTNDYVLKSSKTLELILYTLQIEESKLPKPNGVDPITEDLRRVIVGINQTVNELVNAEREELKFILSTLQTYIEKNEEVER